ncbi:cilia- and flagella-associated protein 52-like [Genypterus blacodes]|uniref:cilia- and flagella-associated protein 52-like n=1 Tax=Genypterus blacodes TaxID=154954 RepID=UPI003F765E66
MASDTQDTPKLQLETVIGFNGRVCAGLRVHPDREHLIYPLGCTVIVKNIKDGKQDFLHGHTQNVTCVAVSKSGRYIATGQVNFMGFKGDVIIWNYAQRAIHARQQLHKNKVEALSFSPNDKYLVSLGGQDDGSIVVWDVETKQAICGSPASAQSTGRCFTVRYSNTNDNVFVSAGTGTLRVWALDLPNRKIRPSECQTGKLKRTVKCIEISHDDQFIFCGTVTGDIMKVFMKTGPLNVCGPKEIKNCLGVTAIRLLKSGDLLVGSGHGLLTLCSANNFETLKEVQLEKGVTSIAVSGEEPHFYVGTEASQIYRVGFSDFKAELISTSHSSAVKDVAIPFGTSELFATCSTDDIRLWHINKPKEVLRITVPNMTCNSLDFMVDGHSIISGWNDGKIRLFGPESGRLMHIINNAHRMGVSAIAGTRDCKRIVSGGEEGGVCVWELQPTSHRLVEVMKQHKATVTCIGIKGNDRECVTSSSDGSCIFWDLVQLVSIKMVLANTMYRTVCYHPGEFHIIAGGTDRKISYWDVSEGWPIRELEASKSGAINAVHITQDGKYFVSGGDDRVVKVWDYMEGCVTHVGVAHSGSITSVKICMNSRTLVSTSADGAILRWKFPHPSSS